MRLQEQYNGNRREIQERHIRKYEGNRTRGANMNITSTKYTTCCLLKSF